MIKTNLLINNSVVDYVGSLVITNKECETSTLMFTLNTECYKDHCKVEVRIDDVTLFSGYVNATTTIITEEAVQCHYTCKASAT